MISQLLRALIDSDPLYVAKRPPLHHDSVAQGSR